MLRSALKSIDMRNELQRNIEACRELCGKMVMASIIHSVLRTRATKVTLEELKAKHQNPMAANLFEFVHDGATYEVRVELMKELVAGEYYTIKDFESKFGISDEVNELLDLAHIFILDNVAALFGKLTKRERSNYSMFERVNHSSNVRGIFHYQKHAQKSFGIIIVEVSSTRSSHGS